MSVVDASTLPDTMGDCGWPMGPHSPACYCGCRPQCESFVNGCLLPFLQGSCGQCLIKNVTGPLCMKSGVRTSKRGYP